MSDLKIGGKVRLAIDTQSIYQIVSINPMVSKGIIIRRFGDGLIIEVTRNDITVIEVTLND